MKEKIFKSIPNVLTISRLLSSFVAPYLFVSGNVLVGLMVYGWGMVSDALDGYLARKLNAQSEFGRKLDAISDKTFALGAILTSIILGNYLMFIPLVLEFVISYISICAKLNNIDPHTIRVGKYKTVSLFPTVVLGLLMTKFNALINVFIPMLFLSSRLQAQTIRGYINEYGRDINKNNDLIDNTNLVKDDNKDITYKDKLISLKNELLFYTCNDINLEKSKYKIRKLG